MIVDCIIDITDDDDDDDDAEDLDSEKRGICSLCVLQVAQHYILCIQTFTKSLGWHVLALNNHIGVGDLEPVGNAVGAIIASPFHDKFVNFLLYLINTIYWFYLS